MHEVVLTNIYMYMVCTTVFVYTCVYYVIYRRYGVTFLTFRNCSLGVLDLLLAHIYIHIYTCIYYVIYRRYGVTSLTETFLSQMLTFLFFRCLRLALSAYIYTYIYIWHRYIYVYIHIYAYLYYTENTFFTEGSRTNFMSIGRV